MLTFGQMFARLAVAVILGAIMGVERETIGKEAGVRTEMVVAAGAAIFAMIGVTIPYIVDGVLPSAQVFSGGIGIIASVVSGIGFLGAGLIIKMNDHPHGVTTAALVWATAAIGVLVGIGLVPFAVTATLLIEALLYTIRKLKVTERLDQTRNLR